MIRTAWTMRSQLLPTTSSLKKGDAIGAYLAHRLRGINWGVRVLARRRQRIQIEEEITHEDSRRTLVSEGRRLGTNIT